MERLTTIPQVAHENFLAQSSIRNIFTKYELKPIEKVKHVINGYAGHPYSLDEVNSVLKSFLKKREKPVSVLRKMSHEDICKVLRNHLKSYLWNREVSDWSYHDWTEFESLKNINDAELQPT